MNSPYSNEVREMTVQPGCPWYDAQQSFGAPNVNWCEPTVCSIINEPANTWSNLAYIIVGLILLRVIKDSTLHRFGPTLIVIGFLSGIYHATNNYLTQYFDFISMFFMMSFLLAFNMNRLFRNLCSNFFATFWFFAFLNSTIFMIFDIVDLPVQKIMLMNTVPIVLLDLFAGWQEGRLKQYRFFFLSLFFLIAAQAFAIMDIKRIYCEPENHFLHGHVLWHLFSAVGLLFIGVHMQRMKNPKFF